ncbi:MAG TPA: hypothetical protein VHI78_01125, partial [Bacteroidales bacterium]|nr:hypothetical protein [Bacteroidales bacterium]
MRIRAILLFLSLSLLLSAQTSPKSIFRTISFRTDSLTFNNYSNSIVSGGERMLYFFYDNEDEIAEITLIPETSLTFSKLYLIPSADYEIIDSLIFFNGAWRSKIRFRNLTQSE